MDKAYHRGRRLPMKESFSNRRFFGRMAAKPFVPQEGEVYDNRNGQTYQCVKVLSDREAVMANVRSGWTFVVHRLYVWPDGSIEWGCSTSGRFEEGGMPR